MRRMPLLQLRALTEAPQEPPSLPTPKEGVATHYRRAAQKMGDAVEELKAFLAKTYPTLSHQNYKGDDLRDMVRITNGMIKEMSKGQSALDDVAAIFEKHYEPVGAMAKKEPPPLPTQQGASKSEKTSDVDEEQQQVYRESIMKDVISALLNLGIGQKVARNMVVKANHEFEWVGKKDEDFSALFKAAQRRRWS